MNADTAETAWGSCASCVAPRSSFWEAVDVEGGGSPRQVLALGIGLAADEARNFLPDAIQVDGPVPVGDEPASLLRSAEQLLHRVAGPGVWIELHGLRAGVADLAWEASTGVAS